MELEDALVARSVPSTAVARSCDEVPLGVAVFGKNDHAAVGPREISTPPAAPPMRTPGH